MPRQKPQSVTAGAHPETVAEGSCGGVEKAVVDVFRLLRTAFLAGSRHIQISENIGTLRPVQARAKIIERLIIRR
jgi:hypothetical protein